MDGLPEGTEHAGRRVPRVVLLITVVFVGYLAFRLIQGVIWLAGHI